MRISIDLSGLAQAAMDEVFAQPVVGLFPPTQLVCNTSAQHLLDFYTISQKVSQVYEELVRDVWRIVADEMLLGWSLGRAGVEGVRDPDLVGD